MIQAFILLRTLLFALVSVSSFAIWTFYGQLFQSTAGLYTACAFVFVLFGGSALLPFSEPNKGKICFRIAWLFPIGFLIFAVFWCLGWFIFKSHFGEIVGSAVGIFALTELFRKGLSFKRSTFEAASVVFFSYTVGYYLGEKVCQEMGGIAGKLLWGGGFGLGMGFGLSYLISLNRDPD